MCTFFGKKDVSHIWQALRKANMLLDIQSSTIQMMLSSHSRGLLPTIQPDITLDKDGFPIVLGLGPMGTMLYAGKLVVILLIA